MLDRLKERVEKETEKILNKEELSIQEVSFLAGEVGRLELLKMKEELDEKEIKNQEKKNEELKEMVSRMFS